MALDPELVKAHDELVAAGGTHELATCPICGPSSQGGASVSPEEMASAIRERDDEIARLNARINELASSEVEREAETKVAAARAEEQAKFDELQTRYDSVVLEAAAAKKAHDDVVAFIEQAAAAKEAEEAAERTKAERLEALKPFTDLLPASYIADNTDRLVAMEQSAFEALVEGWKVALGDKVPDTATIPTHTAMVATAEGWPTRAGSRASDDNKALLGAKSRGIDLRRI